MKHILNASRLDLMLLAPGLQWPVVIGRFLLILATISVLTMPVTEHIWTWDHFLRGGQDFETGMLTIVIILCLAVLLSQLCKRYVDLLLTVYRVLASIFSDGEFAGKWSVRTFSFFHMEQVNGGSIDRYSLPLKI